MNSYICFLSAKTCLSLSKGHYFRCSCWSGLSQVLHAGNAVRLANGHDIPDEQHQSMPNGTSSTDPSNQQVPQQPGPPTDEPKPQKPQQAQQDSAKPFKFDFNPAQQPQQAQQDPQANGTHAKPDTPATGGDDVWTDEQQQMLVKALKAIGKDVKDRYCQLLMH